MSPLSTYPTSPTAGRSIETSGNDPPTSLARTSTVPPLTTPESGWVVVQSTEVTVPRSADAREHPAPPMRTAITSNHIATSSRRRTIACHLLLQGPKQLPEDLVIQPPLGVEGPELGFRRARVTVLVEQLHLLDEPIETKADGRVRDAVSPRQILECPRGEQESLQEREILVRELVEPPMVRPPSHDHLIGSV